MRGETLKMLGVMTDDEFQSTPLMRGETPAPLPWQVEVPISIHSPHARGDAMLTFHNFREF